jgi:hypothetical protein
MKTLRQFALVAALILACAGLSHAQTALTQTTLSQAVNGPSAYNGNTPTTDQCMTLASVTGISAPILPGTPVSVIYVDREAFGVFTVNTTSKVVCGFRGYLSTQAAPHASGAMVLVAPQYQTNLGVGANIVPNGLFSQDPPMNGACTASGTPTTPWVNVLTAAQWLCSPTSSTWVPGFNNPLNPAYMGDMGTSAAATGAQTIAGPFFRLSGTNAITSFTIPVGMNATAVGTASFCVNPTGAFTTTATNNIAFASTAVVGKTLCFTWNAGTSKFSASY